MTDAYGLPAIAPVPADKTGLLSGSSVGSLLVTFSFPDSAGAYDTDYSRYDEPENGFMPIGEPAQDVFRLAFDQISAVTGLIFSETEQMLDGDHIAIAGSTVPSTAWAYGPTGNNQVASDVWFNIERSYFAPLRNGPAGIVGDFAWATVLHELLHSLGLKHGHEAFSGVDPLPARVDGLEFTIMTYRSYVGDTTPGTYSVSSGDYPQTLMALDIAALQELYGANHDYRSGSTTYSVDPETGLFLVDGQVDETSGTGTVFRTIWDGGGMDHLDFQVHSNDLAVDLRPGGGVDLDVGGNAMRARLGNNIYAPAHLTMSLLHEGNTASLIENATGGDGNDRIIGNQVGNVLAGGPGSDVLTGLGGPDVFQGTAADLSGDVITDFQAADAVHILGEADTLSLEETSNGVSLVMGAQGAVALIDLAAQQVLSIGRASSTTAISFANTDSVLLTDGSETYRGRADASNNVDAAGGDDVIVGGALDDTLQGGAGSDQIIGGAGGDLLSGGPGNDELVGGVGPDTFLIHAGDAGSGLTVDTVADFDSSEDRLILGMAEPNIPAAILMLPDGAALQVGVAHYVLFTGYSTEDLTAAVGGGSVMYDPNAYPGGLLAAASERTLSSGTETLVLGTSGMIDGGDGADTIVGAAGEDFLLGGAGSDDLSGGAGEDVLDGGPGSDVMTGGLGADVFIIEFDPSDRLEADFITDFRLFEDTVRIGGYGYSSDADLVFFSSATGASLALSDTDYLVFMDVAEADLISNASAVFEFF